MSSSPNTARVVGIFSLSVQRAETERGSQKNTSLSGASDDELIGKIHSGDQDALGLLFRRYSGLIRGIGKRILRDDAEADDLVQEVFLYIFRNSSNFDSRKGSARSWIVQRIYYRAINRRRYLSSRHHLFEIREPLAEVENECLDFRNSRTSAFDGALVQEILKSLTPDQSETMRLFFFEGYTLAEISVKVDQPLGNVRHHYYRALNKLRARLFPK